MDGSSTNPVTGTYGKPGEGENGRGLGGVYYDWRTGTYRTASGGVVLWGDVFSSLIRPNGVEVAAVIYAGTPGNLAFRGLHFADGTAWYVGDGGKGKGGGGGWLDNIQTGLDVAGIADPTGIVDGVNALIYAGRGQWGNAGISALAIIPYIGDVGKAGRLGAKTLQLTSRARTAENGLELAGKFLKPGYTEIAPGVFRSSDQLRQFRMTTSDITGVHGPGPHFNFEIFSPLNLNKAATNYHVPIINP